MFQPLYPATGAPLHNERVIAIQEQTNLHLKFHLRDVTDGVLSLQKVPVDVVSQSCQELLKSCEST